MKSKWNILLMIVTAILSYLYQSASSNTLIFLDKILSNKCIIYILDHSLQIIIFLLLVYAIAYITVYFDEKDTNINKVCENICKSVYTLIEKTEGHEYMQNVRVSIYKADKPRAPYPVLKMYSRYQTRTPITKSKMKYKPGKGCVGLCFETQSSISRSITEYAVSRKKYITESKKYFNLEKDDIDKINIKSSTFIAVPICFFTSGISWGVLIVDSTKNTNNLEPLARNIETIINTCKVFFEEGGIA